MVLTRLLVESVVTAKDGRMERVWVVDGRDGWGWLGMLGFWWGDRGAYHTFSIFRSIFVLLIVL